MRTINVLKAILHASRTEEPVYFAMRVDGEAGEIQRELYHQWSTHPWAVFSCDNSGPGEGWGDIDIPNSPWRVPTGVAAVIVAKPHDLYLDDERVDPAGMYDEDTEGDFDDCDLPACFLKPVRPHQ
jgi:hypothetical protein